MNNNQDSSVLYRELTAERLMAEAISQRLIHDADLKVIVVSSVTPNSQWMNEVLHPDDRVTRHQVFFGPYFCPFQVLVENKRAADLVQFEQEVEMLLKTYPTEGYEAVHVEAHSEFAGVPLGNLVVVYYNTIMEPTSTTLEAIELVMSCKFTTQLGK